MRRQKNTDWLYQCPICNEYFEELYDPDCPQLKQRCASCTDDANEEYWMFIDQMNREGMWNKSA